MKLYTLTTAILVTLIAFSCNNKPEVIEFNDGQKWKVNAEMTPYILDGEKILKEFNGDNFTDLANQLKDKNNELIKSCNMKGKSHDELHKWLHPHLQLVNELSKAENKQKAEEVIAKLKKSYETYNTYFQ